MSLRSISSLRKVKSASVSSPARKAMFSTVVRLPDAQVDGSGQLEPESVARFECPAEGGVDAL